MTEAGFGAIERAGRVGTNSPGNGRQDDEAADLRLFLERLRPPVELGQYLSIRYAAERLRVRGCLSEK